ncbi:MAG: hypothetical protein NC489_30240 [Ruminococcus flavefaciens]|nr:hypothetical protein [Ruminococcus flavefaciens]
MPTNRYWELYDDQSSEDFTELSYVNLKGETVFVPTEQDLASQVYDLRRRFGANTEIKVYAAEPAVV